MRPSLTLREEHPLLAKLKEVHKALEGQLRAHAPRRALRVFLLAVISRVESSGAALPTVKRARQTFTVSELHATKVSNTAAMGLSSLHKSIVQGLPIVKEARNTNGEFHVRGVVPSQKKKHETQPP